MRNNNFPINCNVINVGLNISPHLDLNWHFWLAFAQYFEPIFFLNKSLVSGLSGSMNMTGQKSRNSQHGNNNRASSPRHFFSPFWSMQTQPLPQPLQWDDEPDEKKRPERHCPSPGPQGSCFFFLKFLLLFTHNFFRCYIELLVNTIDRHPSRSGGGLNYYYMLKRLPPKEYNVDCDGQYHMTNTEAGVAAHSDNDNEVKCTASNLWLRTQW